MSKPTGKLAFAYRTIAALEAELAALKAQQAEQRPAYTMPSCENNYGFGYVDGTCLQSLRGFRDHLEEIVDSVPEGPLYTAPQPAQAQDVAGLVEAARRADDVLSAIIRNNAPLETLAREFGGAEWHIQVDGIRTSLVIALAANDKQSGVKP
jgi:hypothetical protein